MDTGRNRAGADSAGPEGRSGAHAPDFITTTEATMMTVWQEVLHVASIRIGDTFELLGGDSLCAALIAQRIRDLFHLEIPVAEVYGSIEEFATMVDAALLNGAGWLAHDR